MSIHSLGGSTHQHTHPQMGRGQQKREITNDMMLAIYENEAFENLNTVLPCLYFGSIVLFGFWPYSRLILSHVDRYNIYTGCMPMGLGLVLLLLNRHSSSWPP